MALKAQEPETDYQVTPEGVHHAICIWIYDLGTQYSSKWDKYSHRVLITWELPNEILEGDNRPMVISKEYTLSLHSKSQLRKDLEAWRGRAFTAEELKGFELSKLLGANCQLQVIHATTESNTYANIASIMSLPKGSQALKPFNSTIIYEMGQGIPDNTPEWIIKKIEGSKESVPGEQTASEPF